MSPAIRLEQIRQTIEVLESFEESNTESFRIVLITLRQKESSLIKGMDQT